MSDVRPRITPEKPQQELRFTARDPALDESLLMLERDGERHSGLIPENLFLFAMKRIEIDFSDTFDGVSQNHSSFMQYRQAVTNLGNRGMRQFELEPWLKPLNAGGPGGKLVGVGLRVKVDPLIINTVVAPPFYSGDALEAVREAGFIPVRYEIGSVVDDPSDALERLGEMLSLGAWVSQLTIVPSYPRSARLKDIYQEDRLRRSYDQVDQRLGDDHLPPPIPISSMSS